MGVTFSEKANTTSRAKKTKGHQYGRSMKNKVSLYLFLALAILTLCGISEGMSQNNSSIRIVSESLIIENEQNVYYESLVFERDSFAAGLILGFPLVRMVNCRNVTFDRITFRGGRNWKGPNFESESGSGPTNTGDGGAVAIYDSRDITFRRCTFENNAAFRGGALFVGGQSKDIKVEQSRLLDNRAFIQQFDIKDMSFNYFSHIEMSGNIESHNTPFSSKNDDSSWGGAIAIVNSSEVGVINSTFFKNQAVFGAVGYIEHKSYLKVERSFLQRNEAFIQASLFFLGASPVAERGFPSGQQQQQSLSLLNSVVNENRCKQIGKCKMIFQQQQKSVENFEQSYVLVCISLALSGASLLLILVETILTCVDRFRKKENREEIMSEAPILFEWILRITGIYKPSSKICLPYLIAHRIIVFLTCFMLMPVYINFSYDFLPWELMDNVEKLRVFTELILQILLSIGPSIAYVAILIAMKTTYSDVMTYFNEHFKNLTKKMWIVQTVIISGLSTMVFPMIIVGYVVNVFTMLEVAIVGLSIPQNIVTALYWIYVCYVLPFIGLILTGLVVILYVSVSLMVAKYSDFFYQLKDDIETKKFNYDTSVVRHEISKRALERFNRNSSPVVTILLALSAAVIAVTLFWVLLGPIDRGNTFITYLKAMQSLIYILGTFIVLSVLSIVHSYAYIYELGKIRYLFYNPKQDDEKATELPTIDNANVEQVNEEEKEDKEDVKVHPSLRKQVVRIGHQYELMMFIDYLERSAYSYRALIVFDVNILRAVSLAGGASTAIAVTASLASQLQTTFYFSYLQ